MKTVILINQGGGSAGDDASEKVAAALHTAGIEGEIELVKGDQLAKRAKAAVDAGAPLVIAAGGDGTMSAVAGALAGSKTALGLLPLGTLNHLARDLGISFELDEAAAVIAAGKRRTIDMARLNDRLFVNNSAVGLYPLMVADREGQQHRLHRSKRLAMVVAGMRTLGRFHHHRLTLTVNDGGEKVIETPLLFVGNNDYRLDLAGAGERSSIEDGKLCVVAMKKVGRAGFFAALVRALFKRSRPEDMIRLDNVETLKVESRRSRLTVSCDGETLQLAPPLDYRIMPAALIVIAPPPPEPSA